MEECPRKRAGSLAQGREGSGAMATNEKERSDPPMGLLMDRSLGVGLRKFCLLPLSRPLQKILSFVCSQKRLLGRGPDNERWDTLIRSKTGQMSPAMRINFLSVW